MYFLMFNIENILLKTKLQIPPRLWKLMICQVIGWIGYFATHLYFTDFVAIVNIEDFLEIILIFSFTFKGSI
jgi:hypothetical protein